MTIAQLVMVASSAAQHMAPFIMPDGLLPVVDSSAQPKYGGVPASEFPQVIPMQEFSVLYRDKASALTPLRHLSVHA